MQHPRLKIYVQEAHDDLFFAIITNVEILLMIIVEVIFNGGVIAC